MKSSSSRFYARARYLIRYPIIAARTTDQQRAMHAGYVFERVCYFMYTSHILYTALTNPNIFGHLTYWSLCLQSVYFTIDKNSPKAATMVYMVHGTAVIGALAVMLGYTTMVIGGLYRFKSFTDWENAIGRHANTITVNRTFGDLLLQKFYEHYWPVIILLIDKSLNRAALARVYAGARPLRVAVLGMAGYLLIGCTWEQFSHTLGHGSGVDVYQQPFEYKTAFILSKLGYPDDFGLPDDFIYNNVLKVVGIGGAALLYIPIVPPLCKDITKVA